jgi:hypothetical protein
MKSTFQTAFLLSMSLLMGAVACSKGGDNSNPAVVPGVPFQYYGATGCNTCTNPGQGLLASAIAQDTLGSEMDAQFYGDPAIMAMTQGYNPVGYSQGYMQAFPTGTYRGGFAVSGTLRLGQSVTACGLQPGMVLQMQTVQPGIWGNDGAGRSGENVTVALSGSGMQILARMSGYTVPGTSSYGMNGQAFPYRWTTTSLVIQTSYSAYPCTLYLY